MADGSRGRGSSAQGNNLDFVWVVEPRDPAFKKLAIEDRRFDVTVAKSKDGADGWGWSYRAELEDLGTDAEGFAVRAPVAVLVTDDDTIAERAGAAVSGTKIPKSARYLVEHG